jgi:hypothetical protein
MSAAKATKRARQRRRHYRVTKAGKQAAERARTDGRVNPFAAPADNTEALRPRQAVAP